MNMRFSARWFVLVSFAAVAVASFAVTASASASAATNVAHSHHRAAVALGTGVPGSGAGVGALSVGAARTPAGVVAGPSARFHRDIFGIPDPFKFLGRITGIASAIECIQSLGGGASVADIAAKCGSAALLLLKDA